MAKMCNECKRILNYDAFYKKTRSKKYSKTDAGYAHICKQCNVKYRQEYYVENKEYIAKDKRNRFLKKRYGITLYQWQNMYITQSGRCLGCNRHSDEFDKGLVTDHNHKTGQVRGLLCMPCNLILGYALEKIETLHRLVDYIKLYNSELAENTNGVDIPQKKVG